MEKGRGVRGKGERGKREGNCMGGCVMAVGGGGWGWTPLPRCRKYKRRKQSNSKLTSQWSRPAPNLTPNFTRAQAVGIVHWIVDSQTGGQQSRYHNRQYGARIRYVDMLRH